MKTAIIVIVVVLVVIVVVALLIGLALGRFGLRSYQRYSGLERQRGAAKRARTAGVDRLKEAERRLVAAQRDLAAHGEPKQAQAVERLRVRLSTAADRHRYATHGYAPLGSATPVREEELAELQARDADTIGDAQHIDDLCAEIASSAASSSTPDLAPLEQALDRLAASLDRRKALS